MAELNDVQRLVRYLSSIIFYIHGKVIIVEWENNQTIFHDLFALVFKYFVFCLVCSGLSWKVRE